MTGTDYPQGDGDPGCPECQGRGVVPLPPEKRHPMAIGPQTQVCRCVYKRDVLANLERGWRGLSHAKPIPESPLMGAETADLWITSRTMPFKQNLRHVAARKGPRWYFAVVTDADLMDAWLHNVQTKDLLDPDMVERRQGPKPTDRYTALVDLIEPPDLLIIQVGVKHARNSAMPEVLLEALHHRGHLGKPTWIVDHPDQRLTEGHISWDPRVGNFLEPWENTHLEDIIEALPSVEKLTGGEPTPPPPPSRAPTLAPRPPSGGQSIGEEWRERYGVAQPNKKGGRR